MITFGISINYVVFPLFTKDVFNFDASHNGLLFGYVGIIGVMTQGYLVGKFTKRFSEERVLIAGTFFYVLWFVWYDIFGAFFSIFNFYNFFYIW